MSLSEYLSVVLTHKKLIILLTLFITIVSTIGGYFKSPSYEVMTTALIKSALTQPQVTVTAYGSSTTEDLQRKGETFSKLVKSRIIAEKIISILSAERILNKPSTDTGPKSQVAGIIQKINKTVVLLINYAMYGSKQKPDPQLALISKVQKSISTKLIPNTTIFQILVKYSDPVLAADIANTAANVFIDHFKEMTSAEARTARQFIAERVKVAEADLKKAQDELREFIIQEGNVYPETKTNLVLAKLVDFETNLKNTNAEIDQLKTNLAEIRKQLKRYDKTLISSSTTAVNPIIRQLQTNLINLEVQKSNLSFDYGPRHPKMLALNEEIKKVKEQIKQQVDTIIEREEITLNPIYQNLLSNLVTKQIDLSVNQEKKRSLLQITQSIPGELIVSADKQIKWDTLYNAIKFANQNLDSLKSQLETARINEAQKISNISIIDPAIPPQNPSGIPKVAFIFIGLCVGLIGSIGLAFFLEYLDDSIHDIETVEQELMIPIYGIIPEIQLVNKTIKRKKVAANDISNMKNRLVTHFDPKSPVAEAYRSLRTNISFAGISERPLALLVTSSLKNEGKTTTVANLSITLAQLGGKTILIDADLRNPAIHDLFGQSKEPGLSNYISQTAQIEEIITPSGIDNLDLIFSGPIPPNPSELLSTKRMDALRDSLKGAYEFILIDTPPIIAVTDAAILSSKVNGVLLVIHGGVTSKRVCQRAKALLSQANANIIGAVLNNIKIESGYGYKYYYYQYYGEEKKRRKKKKQK